VTTVRFDADLWGRLCAAADRLGVHRAELVRDATREHVARLDQTDRLTRVERRVGAVARAVLRLSGGPAER
jgi:metal-responsive CopG/Arc/MetJ family transcriptional regulator